MFRRIALMGVVLMSLLLAGTVHAQGPGTKHSDPHWRASYWNNVSLSGTPVLEETVEHLGFSWDRGSPHPNVNTDQFSARWSRHFDLEAATYRFAVTSDDGVRVYVDDRLIIDQWNDHPARSHSSDLALTAGHHHVVVEYYENAGVASLAFATWPLPTGTGKWQREFYDNPTLSGAPVGIRVDDKIDFDWGLGKVGPGGPSDLLSIRWTGTFPFQTGAYRFTATADDGIRVYVDQWLIIDEWRDQPAHTYSTVLDLDGGPHKAVVEYYERTGAAAVAVSWTRLPDQAGLWKGEYYANHWLGGTPALTRSDRAVDFNWGSGSPAPQIPSDGFSVRWTCTLGLESGLYRFTTTTDDGVRLWVNNHLLIDKWQDQAARSHSGTIHVSGDVPIKMEYYERGGAASARLAWTRLGDTPMPVPGEVIVDDDDPGFVKGGSSTAWHREEGGYGGSLTWTRNNDRVRPNYNWARWYPTLKPGRYEVYAYIPAQRASTSSARYWVAHYDGLTLCQVDQSANLSRWVSLGTYRFRGSKSDYVSLADVTYEPYLWRQIAFDAVKWVSR